MPETSTPAGWTSALDELERRAGHARTSTEALEPWHPREFDHPIPPELAERAARVLAEQDRAIAELRAQAQQLRSQLQALGTAAPTTSTDVPVYVDTVG